MLNILMIVLVDILFVFCFLYDAQMLQQTGYNNKGKYREFIRKDRTNKSYSYLLKYIIGLIIFSYNKLTTFMYVIIYFILIMQIISSYITYKKYNVKLPLKFTKRMIRISILDILFFLFIQLTYIRFAYTYVVGASFICIALNSYILIFAVFVLKPVEKLIFNHYKKMALEKLNKMPNLNVIGITGSFGKTSTKNILDTILKTKYKGFITPASYNTPNGTILTINNEKSIFNDYFISEMGARKRGEIKELCDLVHPKYGILTCVGEAHLDTFHSIENICNTKFELVESLPEDGVAILNKDDSNVKKYKIKNKCKVIWIGIKNNADVMAKNIKITSKGSTFDIYFADTKKTIKVETVLLGNKNIYNILSAVALASYLGVDDKLISMGVSNINPIKHRLELKNMDNITILDDAYNSNPEGAKMACEVLGLMDGKHIAITPGMVEMGNKQEENNKEFGKQLAKVCDEVYLIGKKQTEPIYDGLMSKKFKKENIHICNSFKDAYNSAISDKKKKTILIENDLPDSYMEGK